MIIRPLRERELAKLKSGIIQYKKEPAFFLFRQAPARGAKQPGRKFSTAVSSSMSTTTYSGTKEETLLKDREKLQEPPFYKVLLHNDDYTTMDFVVMILEMIFGKSTEEATAIMLNVHHQGCGVAGIYTREIGETKVAEVHQLARQNEYPLRCSLERA